MMSTQPIDGPETGTDHGSLRLAGVRDNLTTARRSQKPQIDTVDFIAMCSRQLRAAGRRVGGEDMEQLKALLDLRDVLDEVIAIAVPEVRNNGGYPWAAIGDAAGVTRQSAEERWGRQAQARRQRRAAT